VKRQEAGPRARRRKGRARQEVQHRAPNAWCTAPCAPPLCGGALWSVSC